MLVSTLGGPFVPTMRPRVVDLMWGDLWSEVVVVVHVIRSAQLYLQFAGLYLIRFGSKFVFVVEM